ncbi:MAG: hypothetical protein SGARI_007803 [Bacillariaceae sp.]
MESIGPDTFVDIVCRKACFKNQEGMVVALIRSIRPHRWYQISITSQHIFADFVMECWEQLGVSVQDQNWIFVIFCLTTDIRVQKKLIEYTLSKWGNGGMEQSLWIWGWACDFSLEDDDDDVTCLELLVNHDAFWHALKSHCLDNENEDELREYKAAFSQDDRNAVLELMRDATSLLELRQSFFSSTY